jgi:predicted enzyme related to lactoylglutathione lyase
MPQDGLEEQLPRFCWVDLATADQGAAKLFYGQMFGWTVQDQRAGKGLFSTFASHDAQFASLYQLTRKQIEQGVPSHWTPYVGVPHVDTAVAQALSLGGQVVVPALPSEGTGSA